MPSEVTQDVRVQVTNAADRPPANSPVCAGVWWATRPWINAIAGLTLVGVLAGVLMLATYLGQIRRLDLLQQAAVSKAGLLLLVTWALAMAGALIITIFGSLWFFDSAASIYDSSEDVPRTMPWVLLGGLVLWWILLGVFFSTPRLNTYFAIASWILLVILGGAGYVSGWKAGRGWGGIALRGALVGGTFWFALMLSALAPISLLVIDPAIARETLGLRIAAVCVAVSAPAPTIGWVSFWKFSKGTGWSTVRKNTVVAVLVIAALGLVLFAQSVAMQTLKSVGVYSLAAEQFVVPSSGLVSNLEAAGFPTPPATVGAPGLIVPVNPTGSAKVNAFVRFRFGTSLVLCTTPFNPMERPTSNTPSAYRVEGAHRQARWADGHCLDVPVEDVRRLTPDPGSRRLAPKGSPALHRSPRSTS